MTKTKKIVYWIATIWLATGMLASGLQQVFHAQKFDDILVHLGYPRYLSTILGIWKIAGVIVILLPERFKLVREWAYAGFFFAMSGAVLSHIASQDSLGDTAPALMLLILVVLSRSLTSASRAEVKAKSGLAETAMA